MIIQKHWSRAGYCNPTGSAQMAILTITARVKRVMLVVAHVLVLAPRTAMGTARMDISTKLVNVPPAMLAVIHAMVVLPRTVMATAQMAILITTEHVMVN